MPNSATAEFGGGGGGAARIIRTDRDRNTYAAPCAPPPPCFAPNSAFAEFGIETCPTRASPTWVSPSPASRVRNPAAPNENRLKRNLVVEVLGERSHCGRRPRWRACLAPGVERAGAAEIFPAAAGADRVAGAIE